MAARARLSKHIAALNGHFAAHEEPWFKSFKLDEDTIIFRVCSLRAKGELSLSLYDRSRYPETGGLAFADGDDALTSAVDKIAPAVDQDASLDGTLLALCRALGSPTDLAAQLVGVPRCDDPSASNAAGGAASSTSAPLGDSDTNSDDDDDEHEVEDEDEQANLDYDFARGAELENSLLRLRHQWELRDQKRREETDLTREEVIANATADVAAAPSSQSLKRKHAGGPNKKQAQKQGAHQIFSSAEATRMLCNELFDLMKEEREGFDGVSADCVDFDIHRWRVKVSDISEASPLKKDLEELQRRFGYSSLELELTFTPDMHPFYPAFVKVIRPRLQGVVAEAVMTHPAMTLEGWDPMKRIKWLIRLVQKFVEKHGRVSADDPRNDPSQHPEGAYSAAELAICRLELLAAVTPVWANKEPALLASRNEDVDLARIRELNYGKKKARGEDSKGPWASGVGYGHTGTEGGAQWDVVATEKAQAQADVEMRQMLERVTQSVTSGGLQATTLELSCLRPLLWRQLHTASLLDVGSRPERTSMYTQMLSLLRALASWPALRPVLAAKASESMSGSVLTALESVSKQAQFFLRTTGKAAASRSPADSDAELQSTRMLADAILKTSDDIKQHVTPAASTAASSGGASQTVARIDSPNTVRSGTPRTTRQQAAAAAALANSDKAKSAESSARPEAKQGIASSSRQPAAELDAQYEAEMRALSFEACDSVNGHHFEKRPEGREAASTQLAARTKRLTLEAADMMGGALPVSASSSIWARLHETQIQMWRAMISGPEGTPYSAGCFVFDIICPGDYPNVAPKVNLQTTGGGTVRFNPNLYNCGKVCLSLLGTWQGDQGESWHPKTSTLLQVLMSIQALILVPDPFFNEPGYERNRGTPEGDRQSRSYNETIREGTVRYAMIAQLRSPPEELKEAIYRHFSLRRAHILDQVKEWAADAANSPRHAETMKSLAKELEGALDKHLK